MKHTDWMDATTGNASVRATALKAGLAQRTLANQIEKDRISAENIIAIAVAYNAHPVRALVDTGYLDAKYARQVDPETALRAVSEEALAREILARMKLGLETDILTTPIDELASKRQKQRELEHQAGNVGSFRYVADSSPDEDTERDESDWTNPDNIP